MTGFAKVFTGYQFVATRFPGSTPAIVNYVTPMAVTESRHDKSTKLLLDNVTLPANQTFAQDLTQAMDNIFNNSTIAPYLSKELIYDALKLGFYFLKLIPNCGLEFTHKVTAHDTIDDTTTQ